MVRNKKGFTLIELLIVVVIIGILAAIAIPKFAGTKSKAYVAAMKSDLRNLVTAQESYFSDENTYGAVADNELVTTGGASLWVATSGVDVTTTANNATGFSATAERAGADETCSVCVGTACGDGEIEGEVSC